MNAAIRMHDVVALLDDLPARHFETSQPLLLRRGQIGTVVMTCDDGTAFEWSSPAATPVPSEKLIMLHESPVVAAT